MAAKKKTDDEMKEGNILADPLKAFFSTVNHNEKEPGTASENPMLQIANFSWSMYEAYTAAGFSSEQAFQVILTSISAIFDSLMRSIDF